MQYFKMYFIIQVSLSLISFHISRVSLLVNNNDDDDDDASFGLLNGLLL